MRAFYLLNRYLAHEILKPASFMDIPMTLEGRKVQMYFNKIAQFRSLAPEAIKVIALAQLDPAWSECWKGVWVRRSQKYATTYEGKSYIPLDCIPPITRNCTWKVRTLQYSQVFFIYEILGFLVPYGYPFTHSECWYEKPDIYE